MSITTSDDTSFNSVEPTKSTTLNPGTTGNWAVKTGGTLTLSSPGIYRFRSLQLEPSSRLVVPATGVVQIYVADSLIIRSLIPGQRTILAYLGQAPVQVEALFAGQLFMAPNAAVEVKVSTFGRMFAKSLIVHQDRTITTRVMTPEARALYMPTETVKPLGVMGPTFGFEEISGTVLTSAEAPQCGLANPLAFVSRHSRTVMKGSIGPGSFLNAVDLAPLPFPADPPFGCIPTVYEGDPPPPALAPLFPTVVPTPKPAAFYGYSLTDNLISRLPGGRVMQIGFTTRYCADPPVTGTNCPPAAAPGTACVPATNPNVCSYGGGVPHDAAVDVNCLCADPEGDGTSAWNCQPRRAEGGGLAVRLSSDCGANWSTGVIDLYEIGTKMPSGNPDPLRNTDRPEFYVDPFDDRVFVSSTWTPRQAQPWAHVTVEGRPKSATNAADMSWKVVQNHVFDALPWVMTTVRDEAALLSPPSSPSYGSWVYMANFRCVGTQPTLRVHTPFDSSPDWKEWDLVGASPADTSLLCNTVSKGTNGMPFAQFHYGPSMVGISASPPRFLVAYSGVSNGFEITNVLSVTLRSADGYAHQPEVVRVARVVNGSPLAGHVIFPQLIQADGLGGSDLGVDMPVVLRIATVNGDNIRELALPFYSGLPGQFNQLSSWSLSAAYPGNNCATTAGAGCFIGDYRYGSLVQKQGALQFFTPWIGGNPGAAAGTSVQASLFEIAP